MTSVLSLSPPEVPGQSDPPEHEAVAPAPLPDTVEPEASAPAADDSVITVNGVGLSMESTLGALRAGCKFLNLSQSGSKQRCFQRLQGLCAEGAVGLRG